MTAPPPAGARGNDWRSLPVAPVEFFEPDMVVTVVIPYFEAPEALALTLAGLEGQTYPRELFEVVVVDDGSDPATGAGPADFVAGAGDPPGGPGLRGWLEPETTEHEPQPETSSCSSTATWCPKSDGWPLTPAGTTRPEIS